MTFPVLDVPLGSIEIRRFPFLRKNTATFHPAEPRPILVHNIDEPVTVEKLLSLRPLPGKRSHILALPGFEPPEPAPDPIPPLAAIVHHVDYASQPDLHIDCDDTWTTPAWVTEENPLGSKTDWPNVFEADSGHLYAFFATAVTCPACREKLDAAAREAG